MRYGLRCSRPALLAGLVLVGLCVCAAADEGQTWRVSVSARGEQGNGTSGGRTMSADGRYTAFWSYGSNLVPGDTNGCVDIFVQDRLTGEVERVSVASDGHQANGTSWRPRISMDGRYVSFKSWASNLISHDTNHCSDTFVRDRLTGVTERTSVSSKGEQGNAKSWRASISGDGRYVAFVSSATNLVPGDTNGKDDVFLHDRVTGETRRISVSREGRQAGGDCELPSISGDGRYVVFESDASNLVPCDTNGCRDIFLYDRVTGDIERVSVSSEGTQAKRPSWRAEISGDGRYVAFVSVAPNLVPNDKNNTHDVFVRDLLAGKTERVSVSSGGEEGDGASWLPHITPNGRWVVFRSVASNLAADDTNGLYDIFWRDRKLGITERVSVSTEGEEADGECNDPSVSADGRLVAFNSQASNLVPDDTNGCQDMFERQMLPGDVVVSAPAGLLNEGWNWFSIPLDPAGWAEASNLLGSCCRNHLYRWDQTGKRYEIYGDDFANLARGCGYALLLDTEAGLSYEALAPSGDFEIPLRGRGWICIGHPFTQDTLLGDIAVRENTSGQTRSAWTDYAAERSWVNWNLMYWDAASDSWMILGLEGADDSRLRPWRAYLIWSMRGNLTLIVPCPSR